MRNQYDAYVTKELEINLKALEIDVCLPPKNKSRNFKINLTTSSEYKNGLSKDSDAGDDAGSLNSAEEQHSVSPPQDKAK